MEAVEVLSGDDPDGLVLAASGASELALPVTLGFDDLYELVLATRGEDLIDFGLAGSFGFNTPVGPINLPYTEGGDFPALRRPDITFTGITVEELTFLDATLAINLDIDNDHGTSMLFQQASWVLQLGGLNAGSGLVSDLAEVAGASTESVSIPVTINFLDMGAALYDLLRSGTVDANLQATVDVDTPFGTLPFSFSREGEIPLY
jgi:LEA14-like dessication related protein